jgi:hypothetical protein
LDYCSFSSLRSLQYLRTEQKNNTVRERQTGASPVHGISRQEPDQQPRREPEIAVRVVICRREG